MQSHELLLYARQMLASVRAYDNSSLASTPQFAKVKPRRGDFAN